MDTNLYEPLALSELTGHEEILPGIKVTDFWSWALGDLRFNSTRGLLAQFLVAKAVGDSRRIDDGWGPYDVESATGIRIEVKSSGYLQSWRQTKLSSIGFGGLITQRWNDVTNKWSEKMVIADVYVFAVHTCTEVAQYDPLNLNFWEFYVLPGSTIRSRNKPRIALSVVRKLAGESTTWQELHAAIERANNENAAS